MLWLRGLSKYGSVTRSIAKVMLRYLTGKCELERLCESGQIASKECMEIEFCLYHSKMADIQRILTSDEASTKSCMETIMRRKRIISEKSQAFLHVMPKFLRKIISYNKLLTEIDGIRGTVYNEEDKEHEKLLHRLWEILKGDEIEERYSSRWTEIGFQGKNPATDFRGMGILSLKCLIYLLEQAPAKGFKIFGQSQHPKYGYSFAVMGISFTGTVFELLRNGKLKQHIYNLDTDHYAVEDFCKYFVHVFSEFSDFWISKEPPDIMSFNEIKKEFMISVLCID